MIELLPWAWVILGIAAVTVGLAKTAIPGSGILPVALFATVLPARTSTAALLLLLIVGDLFALIAYRRHALAEPAAPRARSAGRPSRRIRLPRLRR